MSDLQIYYLFKQEFQKVDQQGAPNAARTISSKAWNPHVDTIYDTI